VKIATEAPAPPQALRPELPDALAQLVQRAMAKHVEERTPSIEALIHELEPFADPASYPAGTAPDSLYLRARPHDAAEAAPPVEPTWAAVDALGASPTSTEGTAAFQPPVRSAPPGALSTGDAWSRSPASAARRARVPPVAALGPWRSPSPYSPCWPCETVALV
jgi:hypothetical protein